MAASAAFFFILCDRALSFVAGWQRLELLSLVIASPLVLALIRRAQGKDLSRVQFVILLISTFVAPLTHPIAAALTATSLILSAWLCFRAKKRIAPLVLQFAIYGLSLLTLIAWFTLRPALLAQFQDHVGVAKTTLVPGQILLNSMNEIYYPLVTGPLFYGGGLLLSIVVVLVVHKPLENRRWRPEQDALWALAWLILGIGLSLNVFKNAYYLVFLLLPTCPLFALAALELQRIWPALSHVRQSVFVSILFFLICIHGAFWATRAFKWWQAGRPDLRRELHQFWAALPPCHHLYIPEALWEEAARNPKRGSEILMNTIVNNSSIERRKAYEAYAYAKVEPGDLLILDDCQSNSPATRPVLSRWQLIGTAVDHPPGRMQWGYGFKLYRAL